MAVYAGFISPPIAVIDAVRFFCMGEIGLTELKTIPTIGECQLRKRIIYRGGEIDTPPVSARADTGKRESIMLKARSRARMRFFIGASLSVL